MRTHTHTETCHESPSETTTDPDGESDSSDDTTSRTGSADGHYAAATFDAGDTLRLPNTVDENRWVG